MKNGNGINRFVCEYNIGSLIAEKEDDIIIIKNADGKRLYNLSANYMIDSNQKVSNNVSINILSQQNGFLEVELVADNDWLQDPERAYPVTIDPNFYSEQDETAIQSAFIDSDEPNTTHGDWNYITYTGTYGEGIYRTFIKLNTLPTLNKGDIIVDAKVALYNANRTLIGDYLGQYYTDEYVGAYKVTGNWNKSTITWNNSPGYEIPLLDYHKFTSSSTDEWVQWDITNVFKSWYEAPASNYGICLRSMGNESQNQCSAFISSNMSFTGSARPLFVLTYRNNKGIEIIGPIHRLTWVLREH